MLREGRPARFTRVLNPHEQGALVWRKSDTGYLTSHRPDHEAPNLAAERIGTEHLVIAHTGKITAIAVIAIGEDPQPAIRVEAQSVGTVEHVLRGNIA
ncbi:hypothetical protein D3C84_1048270 [compost metagenome]